jgi:predicted nucleic acid-binding protein
MVLDASAVLEILLGTAAGARLRRRIVSSGATLHAPHLVDVEVAHVLRRYAIAGELSEVRGQMALTDLADMAITRYAHDRLLTRVWQLRDNLTGYDAVYVALSEALGAPLVTRDRRLALASGHHAAVEVLD